MKICLLYWSTDSLGSEQGHHEYAGLALRALPSPAGPSHSRRHVLNDAVEQIEALVVVGLGRNQLLEDAEQPGLWGSEQQ